MRRIAIWIASTATIVVLLFGYHTSTNRVTTVNGGTTAGTGQQPSTSSTGSAGGSPPESESAGQSSSSSSSSSSNKTSGGSGSSTTKSTSKQSFTGDAAATEWGPVQVKIVVKNKKITSVTVLQSPNGNPRDYEINSYALPILVQETISAQSANIDMISGATVTSGGYIQSLQSALDQAGI